MSQAKPSQPESMTLGRSKTALDRIGSFASSACAVHCGVCAVAPGILATLGISWLAGHKTEWAFTMIAVSIALVAMVSAWRSHRSHLALSLLSIGAVGLMLSRGVEEGGSHAWGAGIGVASGLVLLAGHLANLRVARANRAGCQTASGLGY